MTEPKLRADFAQRYGPRALILGGSEGIGAAFADHLAASGLDLTLVARSPGPLNAAAEELRGRYGVAVDAHALDLTASDLARSAADLLSRDEFGLVIYNAGATHGVGLFLDKPMDHALNLIRLNCDGPAIFSHLALSAMRKILVSSMSAMVGSGYVAAYAAAKSFGVVLAEGLNWELRQDGVDVMCAVASLTDTPAMQRSGMVTDGDLKPMSADEVAVGALRHLGAGPVWYAVGEQAIEAMRSVPRPALTENASAISARLWGIEVEKAARKPES